MVVRWLMLVVVMKVMHTWFWMRSLTRSMGAAAVFETAAETPPIKKSTTKPGWMNVSLARLVKSQLRTHLQLAVSISERAYPSLIKFVLRKQGRPMSLRWKLRRSLSWAAGAEEGAFGDKEEEHTMPKADLSFECVSHQFLSFELDMSVPVEPPL
jgi:hypothetical protein